MPNVCNHCIVLNIHVTVYLLLIYVFEWRKHGVRCAHKTPTSLSETTDPLAGVVGFAPTLLQGTFLQIEGKLRPSYFCLSRAVEKHMAGSAPWVFVCLCVQCVVIKLYIFTGSCALLIAREFLHNTSRDQWKLLFWEQEVMAEIEKILIFFIYRVCMGSGVETVTTYHAAKVKLPTKIQSMQPLKLQQ